MSNSTYQERLNHIKEHPELHHHTFQGLRACCAVNGLLDMRLIDAHSEHVTLGQNGGVT